MTDGPGCLVTTAAGVAAVRAKVRRCLDLAVAFGFDTEFDAPELKAGTSRKLDVLRAKLVGYSLAFPEAAGGGDYYIPASSPEARRLLRFVEYAPCWVWAHNWKAELQVLTNEGYQVRCRCFDSEIAAWMAGWKQPGKGGLKLKPLAEAILGYSNLQTFEDVAAGRKASEVTPAELAPYAARDARLALELGEKAYDKLARFDCLCHFDLERRCLPVTAHMEATGVPLDRARLLEAAGACERELVAVAAEFRELTKTTVELPVKVRRPKPCPNCAELRDLRAEGVLLHCSGEGKKTCVGGMLHHRNGKPVHHTVEELQPVEAGCDIGSDAKVSRWLFRELKWWEEVPRHEQVEYGPSVAAEFVRRYAVQSGNGGLAARLRLRFQALRKYATTYTRTLVALADQSGDGKLHTSYKQDGTDTTRYSSSMPNQSNLPKSKRQELPWLNDLPDIRACFVAPEGWEITILDFSQIELRLAAHYSNDPAMVEAYRTGQDLHDITLRSIGGTCTRTEAKNTNFSVLYEIWARTLAERMALYANDFERYNEVVAQGFIDGFFRAYPLVGDMQDSMAEAAEHLGYAETITGFKRPIREWGTRYERGKSRRKAINTPIQGSAGCILKLALVGLYERWTRLGVLPNHVRIVGQTYDEIIVQNRAGHGEKVRAAMKEVMEGVGVALGLRVPLVATGGSGPNWSAAK